MSQVVSSIEKVVASITLKSVKNGRAVIGSSLALLGIVVAAVAALAVQGDEDPSPPIPGLGLFR